MLTRESCPGQKMLPVGVNVAVVTATVVWLYNSYRAEQYPSAHAFNEAAMFSVRRYMGEEWSRFNSPDPHRIEDKLEHMFYMLARSGAVSIIRSPHSYLDIVRPVHEWRVVVASLLLQGALHPDIGADLPSRPPEMYRLDPPLLTTTVFRKRGKQKG